MSLLYTVSFKEFGSLVCLWHDVKIRKTQLEVRSLNVTWRRHRVIVFWKCVKLLAEQLWQIWRRHVFSLSAKNLRGGADNRPPAVRGLNTELCFARWILVGGTLTDTMINDQILILIATQNIQIELCLRGWKIGYKLTAKKIALKVIWSPSWALFIPL